ncbi:MAG TPA: TerC/Alx family metal homeostasis membrane protein [Nitrososphaeraceae archaeon]|nr:TerC/Alx family metal homeostasis membrane protein [Nitrososphaeraceae archaeon]
MTSEMDFTTPLADNIYPLMWILFSLFIGIALAVDIGVSDKIKQFKKKIDSSTYTKSKYRLTQDVKVSSRSFSKELPVQQGKEEEEEQLQEQEQKQTFRRALIWTILWISLAGIFAGIVFVTLGSDKALLFVTGYAIEKSLSVDNMFVFLLIFSSLAIPHVYQHKVLMAGILSAIAMRIGLILAGVSLLESFHWMIYIFGGLLLFTGIRMLVQKKEKKIEIEKNIAVRIMKRFIPVSLEIHGNRFLSRKNGIIYATPMLVALVIVEMTDLVFALDSIPAILAITIDPFIVITSNIFAILGLRSLYFLLAGMMEKFYYLKPGLALVLLFIGTKMVASEFYKIPIMISLVVIFGILAIAMILSFIRSRSAVIMTDKSK